MAANDIDLALVGVGITGLQQLTRQAEGVIKDARKVFHLTGIHPQLEALNQNGEVINNAEMYWTGDRQTSVYQKIMQRIQEEVEKGPGVVNVIYGHPLFYDDINNGLIKWANENSKSYLVVPGISCLDTLSADLEIDYSPGLQVYEAGHMVHNQFALNPKIKTIIMQLGTFGMKYTRKDLENFPGRYKPLEDHLLKYFPPDHECVIAFSDRGDSWVQTQESVPISQLDEHQEKMYRGTTMYIPPVGS